jgi:hypothetical protein
MPHFLPVCALPSVVRLPRLVPHSGELPESPSGALRR